jgi:hypothetical protein
VCQRNNCAVCSNEKKNFTSSLAWTIFKIKQKNDERDSLLRVIVDPLFGTAHTLTYLKHQSSEEKIVFSVIHFCFCLKLFFFENKIGGGGGCSTDEIVSYKLECTARAGATTVGLTTLCLTTLGVITQNNARPKAK